MPLNSKSLWFSGMEVLTDDMSYNDTGRVQQDRFRVNDLWTDGVLNDPNGLSNMTVSIDATTNTLFNVTQGTAYSNGFRISIDSDLAYSAGGPTFTTNGICTPVSSGNRGIPLANYNLNQPNYIWAEYLAAINTGRTAIAFTDGSIHYPQEQDGYQIVVTTNNNPGNPVGITNSVYLATIFGKGSGNPLSSNPVTGLTDISKLYSHIRPNVSVGSGIVRGSTANIGGVQQEILQGTVSTPDLRDSAVSATKIRSSDTFTMNGLTVSGPGTALTVSNGFIAGIGNVTGLLSTNALTVSGAGTSMLVTNNIDLGGDLYQANIRGITSTSIRPGGIFTTNLGNGIVTDANMSDMAAYKLTGDITVGSPSTSAHGIISFPNQSSVYATKSGDDNPFANGATLTFNTIQYDTHGEFTGGQLFIPNLASGVSGKYLITLSANFDNEDWFVELVDSGGSSLQYPDFHAITFGTHRFVQFSFVVKLTGPYPSFGSSVKFLAFNSEALAGINYAASTQIAIQKVG